MSVKLVERDSVDRFREASKSQSVGKLRLMTLDYPSGYRTDCGERMKEVSTGRATCRVCGSRIAKGEECLSYYISFSGDNEYTVQKVYIHSHEC